jgi:hemolysin activation/secretion protein
MSLRSDYGILGARRWNFARKAKSKVRIRQVLRLALLPGVFLMVLPVSTPSVAQQASQPAFDPRELSKRFDRGPLEQAPSTRTHLPMPRLARPAEAKADAAPLFVLRHISIVGATSIPPDRLATTYRRYLGKKVSQADLAAIANDISDVYRAAGFHLTRAIVPPQEIKHGTIRIHVIEGRITSVELKGEGAAEFGIRPMLSPVLSEQPSRLSTLERQLLLINGRPGVRIEDTTLDEIGNGSGQFRLTVFLKTWHVFTSFGIDNLGSASVGPWQSYATAAFNSYLAPGDALTVNLSTTPGDPRQLAFGRVSYDVPVGTDGLKVGASGIYSEVWPGDYRHAYSDNTKTEAFELRASFAPLQSQREGLTLTTAADF